MFTNFTNWVIDRVALLIEGYFVNTIVFSQSNPIKLNQTQSNYSNLLSYPCFHVFVLMCDGYE